MIEKLYSVLGNLRPSRCFGIIPAEIFHNTVPMNARNISYEVRNKAIDLVDSLFKNKVIKKNYFTTI